MNLRIFAMPLCLLFLTTPGTQADEGMPEELRALLEHFDVDAEHAEIEVMIEKKEGGRSVIRIEISTGGDQHSDHDEDGEHEHADQDDDDHEHGEHDDGEHEHEDHDDAGHSEGDMDRGRQRVRRIRSAIGDSMRQYNDMKEQLGEEHPKVRNIERRIRMFEEEMAQSEQIRRRPPPQNRERHREVDREHRMEDVEIETRRRPPPRRGELNRPAPNEHRRGVEERFERMEARFERLERLLQRVMEQLSEQLSEHE